MGNQRILIVEDEPDIAGILSDYLKNDDFDTHWIINGNEVVPFLKKEKVDLVLLDILLPIKNGIEVCKEIRQFSNIPVIIISARGQENERILGLDIGADDYVCKPFSPKEVVARVKANLRRFNKQSISNDDFQTNTIYLDSINKQIKINQTAIDLTTCELSILTQLFLRPGEVFSREQLIPHINDESDCMSIERRIDFHIKNLRKKFEKYLNDRDMIKTVYGEGYKLKAKAGQIRLIH
jgi:two-component system response regulator BaeR